MATVTSLTAARILELMAGWDGVVSDQAGLSAVVAALNAQLEANNLDLIALNEEILPALQADLAAGSILLSDLNETTLPNLATTLAANTADLNDLNTVTLPALQADLAAGIANSLDRSQVFFTDTAPTGTTDRALKVNDVWYDTNDGNKSYRWDGTTWLPFAIDIPNLSLTVQKFQTSTHMIY